MKRSLVAAIAFASLVCSLTGFAQPDTLWTRALWRADVAGAFEADDGGLFLVSSNQITEDLPVSITKLSASGDSLWSVSYDAPYSRDNCDDARRFANGDFLLRVFSWQDAGTTGTWEVRISESGDIIWERESQLDVFAFAADSAIIDVQRRQNGTGPYIAVTKLSATRDTIWSRSHIFDDLDPWPKKAIVDASGRVLVSGALRSSNWPWPGGGFVVCYDVDGTERWSREIRSDTANFYISEIHVCDDSSVAATGTWYSVHGALAAIVKLSSQGDVLWDTLFAPTGRGYAELDQTMLAGSNTITGVGATGDYSSEPWFFRADEHGTVEWEVCCWRENTSRIWKQWLFELSNGEFIVAASTLDGGLPENPSGIHLARLSLDPENAEGIPQGLLTTLCLHPNYPNPFNPVTEISFELPRSTHATLRVFDLLGREVAMLVNGALSAGTHLATFDATSFASGVYFYRLEAESFIETRKMVLLK